MPLARAAAVAPQDEPLLSVVSPAPNTQMWLNPEVPPEMSRLALRARVAPGITQIVWQVDGEDYAVADPAAPLYWPLVRGLHRFRVRLPLQRGASAAVRVLVSQ